MIREIFNHTGKRKGERGVNVIFKDASGLSVCKTVHGVSKEGLRELFTLFLYDYAFSGTMKNYKR